MRSRGLDRLKCCCFLPQVSKHGRVSRGLLRLHVLEEKDIAGDRDATNRLAMRSVAVPYQLGLSLGTGESTNLRVREGDALVVGEVQAVVLSLPTGHAT